MNNGLLFKASAVIEVLTGVALLVAPSLVIELLLGSGLSSIGIAVSRVLGVGLLSLGVAAWDITRLAPKVGICIYNLGAATLLSYFGTLGEMNGILLWPAAALHGIVSAAMTWVILINSQPA